MSLLGSTSCASPFRHRGVGILDGGPHPTPSSTQELDASAIIDGNQPPHTPPSSRIGQGNIISTHAYGPESHIRSINSANFPANSNVRPTPHTPSSPIKASTSRASLCPIEATDSLPSLLDVEMQEDLSPADDWMSRSHVLDFMDGVRFAKSRLQDLSTQSLASMSPKHHSTIQPPAASVFAQSAEWAIEDTHFACLPRCYQPLPQLRLPTCIDPRLLNDSGACPPAPSHMNQIAIPNLHLLAAAEEETMEDSVLESVLATSEDGEPPSPYAFQMFGGSSWKNRCTDDWEATMKTRQQRSSKALRTNLTRLSLTAIPARPSLSGKTQPALKNPSYPASSATTSAKITIKPCGSRASARLAARTSPAAASPMLTLSEAEGEMTDQRYPAALSMLFPAFIPNTKKLLWRRASGPWAISCEVDNRNLKYVNVLYTPTADEKPSCDVWVPLVRQSKFNYADKRLYQHLSGSLPSDAFGRKVAPWASLFDYDEDWRMFKAALEAVSGTKPEDDPQP